MDSIYTNALQGTLASVNHNSKRDKPVYGNPKKLGDNERFNAVHNRVAKINDTEHKKK